MKRREVIGIVGCGTAGLAAAIAFSRAGHSVTIYESHASLTSRGAGVLIQPPGLRALRELGVSDAFEAASVPIDRLLGVCHRDWTLVDVPYPNAAARAVSRGRLSQLLFEEARSLGAQFRFGTHIRIVDIEGASAVVRTNEDSRAFDLLVVASGASSVLPAQLELAVAARKYTWGALWGMFDVKDWPEERVLAQRYRTTRQMYGLMPTERVGDRLRLSLFWSMREQEYPEWVRSPLTIWKEQLLSLWPESEPVVSQITSHSQLSFASYRHSRPRTLAKPPVCLVGDAAHSMSPQLGLGSTLAVQDALVLARCVREHGAAEGALAYSRARLRAVKGHQLLSWALTPWFQADSGGLWRDVLLGIGMRLPGMPWLMYRSVAGASQPV